jgi:Uma2 family endonuclease
MSIDVLDDDVLDDDELEEAHQEIIYRTMPFEEFDALPDDVRAEYIDGTALIMPAPIDYHQALVAEFMHLFHASLPGTKQLAEAGLRTVRDGHRIPDLQVVRSLLGVSWRTEPPIIAVEVTSPATRNLDRNVKVGEYAAAGVGQFWLLDRKDRTLTTYEGTTAILTLSDEHPTGAVTVGDHGTVNVDLHNLLNACGPS